MSEANYHNVEPEASSEADPNLQPVSSVAKVGLSEEVFGEKSS